MTVGSGIAPDLLTASFGPRRARGLVASLIVGRSNRKSVSDFSWAASWTTYRRWGLSPRP